MTNYQRRMTSFTRIGGFTATCAVVFCIWKDIGPLGWLVLIVGGGLFFALAAGFDAVYDSLHERLDRVIDQMPRRPDDHNDY